MNFQILNIEGHRYPQRSTDLLSRIGSVKIAVLKREELLEIVEKYSILIVGLNLEIDKEIMDRASNLKIIASATTGVDHIDCAYASLKGIEIISLKGEDEFLQTVTSTAEFAFGLILSLIRKIPWGVQCVKEYDWHPNINIGFELLGKTLGIIGFGRLGKLMAKYANGFGMKVISYDPFKTEKEFQEKNVVRIDSLDTLLSGSDIVSLHVSLSEDNIKMIGEKEFKAMKNSAYFINTSRGQLVDEEALLQALKSRKIAGAATDVLADENKIRHEFLRHPLVEYSKQNDNLLVTPHIAGTAMESTEKTRAFIVNKIIRRWKERSGDTTNYNVPRE